jgi:hypothetical protein
MTEKHHSRSIPELDPAAEMVRLRARALGDHRQSGDLNLLGLGDLEIWRPRQISSHRPFIGALYAGIRRWVYREIRLSVEQALTAQGRINAELARLLRRRDGGGH